MSAYNPAWHLSGQPYPVQIEALKKAHGKLRFGHWIEMGLGKGPLVLNDWIENLSEYDTACVICPNSFRMDWALMPRDWGLDFSTSMWPDDSFKVGSPSKFHLNVINFEAVRSSGYEHVKRILDARPCLLIVDESSFTKNWKAQTTKAVSDLCKRAKAVRLLNGTPLVQNVLDLYPQLKMLGELNGVNPYAFRNRFAVCGGFMGKQIIGVKNEEELLQIQSRVTYRALKRDWWEDCPEKRYIPINLEMTPKQRKHYKEMLEDFFTLVAGHEYTASMVLGQLEKSRQIASGLILDGDKCEFLVEIDKNPKAKAALDLIDAAPGKLIVVYQYREMGKALFDLFKRKKLHPTYIKGGMTANEVSEQKRLFNDVSKHRILVAQIQSTSMAHTLLGGDGDDRCYRMVFQDQTFNLRDRMQVEDRIHRGKQDRNCLYFDPVLSPVDDAQRQALTKKTDLVKTVVDAVRALRTGS